MALNSYAAVHGFLALAACEWYFSDNHGIDRSTCPGCLILKFASDVYVGQRINIVLEEISPSLPWV